ncbi:DUF1801 domain-containing protein [Salinicoccus halodurans]|uniref:YdhG-like domain-containing protein n=1 Tax=Salinicoccus halodurans TaxID=407035 RepID=A0A0F7HHY3_9STAP|nr:DUF1801 domain-containing protein [Salinicoccus halodurans]AKG73102.1 hypothetical protein AAT16_02050 [Salinicoccus halodurans]SFK85452.1 protein of unknown function (DU1801) [Salinicoccus halodurans]
MTFDEYVDNIDEKWRESFIRTWNVISEHLPEGFDVYIHHGMPGFVVPKDRYPEGYHVDNEPLPFIGVASQKRHLAVYHMGMYRDPELYDWFAGEYPRHMSTKLNMGKSCIRFTNPGKVPYDLLGQLAEKTSVDEWIELYESRKQ